MTANHPSHPDSAVASAASRGRFVPLVLLIAAAALWAGPWEFTNPAAPSAPTPAWAIDPTPVRRPKLRPEIDLAGFTYHCSDCHRHFASPPETVRSLTQHRHIELRHGINTRCFNCHHLTNRDALVDDWGREIPFDQPQLVCAKCHGPVYRDWLNGSHGRTNGYWDASAGRRDRRKCIECHDPHVPPFPPMPPAPGPNTLRMGDQSPVDHHGGTPNPLRPPGRGAHAEPHLTPPPPPPAGPPNMEDRQ
mgnify:CR=1 FL=1